MLIQSPIRVPMSKEEFFRRASLRDECLQDWEEGVAVKLGPAHGRHGWFIFRLMAQLEKWLADNQDGVVRQEVFVDFETRAYGVDLMVLFAEHADQYRDGRVFGSPDIIVEVLSNDSIERDRVTKFDFYCSHTVPWYWIGDPVAGTLEEYHHTSAGYIRSASGTRQQTFRPQSLPGLAVDVQTLLES